MAAKKARKGGLINENQRRQLEAIGDWPPTQTPPPPPKRKAPAKKSPKRKK